MRLATFNVENLFTRFRFAHGVDPDDAAQHGFTSEDLRQRIAQADAKVLTAKLISLIDADVVALQEVEGMGTLKRFRDLYLGGRQNYPYLLAIDGNDERGIDVAVLSRLPLVHARSYQHLWDVSAPKPVFSRDCLEVDVACPRLGVVSLYINHFKSMRDDGQDGGRARTRPLRQRQCRTVMDIVRARFGPSPGDHAWAILGDFNDYLATDEQGPSGIDELVHWREACNVVARRPENDRWTHFWRGLPERGLPASYEQLDYLLLSRRLGEQSPEVPHIERRGQPGRAARYSGPRLDGIGFDRPKASDHCPIVMQVGAMHADGDAPHR
ncbi:MAG: endonuclease/exonuclease/phosphatase family protein [Deltaproteobacteria bacterium]|nr:endonuclease/exonuclease/phosphatase family protein [Deltaproteobacteria bacterium]